MAKHLGEPLGASRDVRILFTVFPIGCGEVKVENIGVMATAARKNNKPFEAVRFFVKGKLGEHAHLGDAD